MGASAAQTWIVSSIGGVDARRLGLGAPKEFLACPCCGYRTITEEWDICEVCGWEHDSVQSNNPDYAGGANRPSLREAQRNFERFGAKDRDCPNHGKPDGFERDPDWRPLASDP